MPSTTSPVDLREAAKLFWRAVRLRCPNCGGGKIFDSYLRLKDHCPTCGLQLERGESDYFLGAYLFNLVAVELLFGVGLAIIMIATWPDPPWALLEWGGAGLMVVGAIICYPLGKTTWLAFDLMLRPLSPEELEWHRSGKRPADDSLPQE